MRAAKERKRMEGPPPDRPPRMKKLWLSGWKITLENTVDGASVTFYPTSVRDCFRRLAIIFRYYVPLRLTNPSRYEHTYPARK